ncbi:MAG: histidine phosphatase family protein, partial [Deltaproteobacteria bacterium]|nr:histidine phosphatase family protein [Deltaproteobacteria bacterium]
MQLYLMQHGQALPKDQDPDQGLSPEGVSQIETSGRALARLDLKLDWIVASPKLRSKQTAGIIAQSLGLEAGRIVETELVKPLAPPLETIGYLAGLQDTEAVLVAGHLPSLAQVASALISAGGKAAVGFENGALVR